MGRCFLNNFFLLLAKSPRKPSVYWSPLLSWSRSFKSTTLFIMDFKGDIPQLFSKTLRTARLQNIFINCYLWKARYWLIGTSCTELFCNFTIMKNFIKFIRKHLWHSHFLIEFQVVSCRPGERLEDRCSFVNFEKFFRILLS